MRVTAFLKIVSTKGYVGPVYWQTKASWQQSLRKARLRATKKYNFDEATQSKMQVAWVRNINALLKFMVGKQISFK